MTKTVSIVAIAIALTACGSGTSDDPSHLLTENAITEWGGQALPPEQLEFTADGVVTEAEITLAYEGLAECINANVPFMRMTPMGFRDFEYHFEGNPENSDFDAYRDVALECETSFIQPLDAIFDYQNRPEGEKREAAFADFQECLRTHGTLPDGIYLGQPQHEMMRAVTDVNLDPELWPLELHECIQRNYNALWPETIPGNPDYQ